MIPSFSLHMLGASLDTSLPPQPPAQPRTPAPATAMDHDHLKDRLLLPSSRAAATNGPHHRRATPAPGTGAGGPPCGGGAGGVSIDVNGLKRRGGGRRSWVRVDAATGAAEAVEVAKPALMRRLDLPARDLRLLDPLFVYPSAILGRERAVVCNLERLRCIITADEALVLREPDAAAEEAVRSYVDELQRRLVDRADDLPFEFIALEVALEAACSFLDSQVPPLLSGSVSFWVLVESSDSHCLLHVSANDTAR